MKRLNYLLLIGLLLACVAPARADIFQWEYINPADPGQGKQQGTTLAPGGAGVNAVPNAQLIFLDLTMAYLIGADPTGAWKGLVSPTTYNVWRANFGATLGGGGSLSPTVPEPSVLLLHSFGLAAMVAKRLARPTQRGGERND